MLHVPVNHPLRPLYRVLAVLAGLYILIFGIVGLTQTGGVGVFARSGLPSVLGLRTNPAFAVLSIVVGLLIVIASVVGRNLDQYVDLAGGVVFLLAGLIMMVLMQTDLNFLGFTMATCVVSFLIGLVLGTAGLYARMGSPQLAQREELLRTADEAIAAHRKEQHPVR